MRARSAILAAVVLALALVAAAAVLWWLPDQRDVDPTAGAAVFFPVSSALGASESTPTVQLAESGLPDAVVLPAHPRQATPIELPEFDVGRTLDTVRDLEAFGPRGGGSAAEADAATYLRDRLVAAGMDALVEEFALPNGTISRNVVARIPGSVDAVLVLGAHMDTKPPSPGANDNASGCGALLEIARLLAADPPLPTIEVVFFGSEEVIGGDPNAHHFGSRYRVSQMTEAERKTVAGMISIDMIGYGPAFHSRTMGRGPMVLSDMLLSRADAMGIRMTYRRDPGASGWSDHEAYELAGVPVAWLEWRDDPVYHTADDTSAHLSSTKIEAAGSLVLEFVRGLDAESLRELTDR